jgi:isopropylmalate/homocitrate/citramalate synthase
MSGGYHMGKIEFSKKTNVIEQSVYKYSLQDIEEPNLYRDLFPYSEIPRIAFNHRHVPMNVPEEIWITDTTFRDGQQSRAPYTTKQMEHIYDKMHELDNDAGIIRQTEFFLYSKKDRDAAFKCLEKGYRFPEVTSWIRACREDFQLVKEAGIKETGILVSCSDYHIFKKLKMKRSQAMAQYLGIVEAALENGITPRCHFEDITRADFYGFVVPFATELMKLSRESGIPIKIRACDTMGLGIAIPGTALPRSVPGIIYGLNHYADVPSENIEWHGHNDFYKAVNNSTTAWLYGASSVNTSLFGIGERTGNTPLEAMVVEYIQLRGDDRGMNLSVLTDLAEYFDKELGYTVPPMTPFVGKAFNLTKAGIHADGILKDEEIYNIFDTKKILNRPIVIAIDSHSGLAGIAAWINSRYGLKGKNKIDKKDSRIQAIKEWIDKEYESARVTTISDEEMENAVNLYMSDNLKLVSSAE